MFSPAKTEKRTRRSRTSTTMKPAFLTDRILPRRTLECQQFYFKNSIKRKFILCIYYYLICINSTAIAPRKFPETKSFISREIRQTQPLRNNPILRTICLAKEYSLLYSVLYTKNRIPCRRQAHRTDGKTECGRTEGIIT